MQWLVCWFKDQGKKGVCAGKNCGPVTLWLLLPFSISLSCLLTVILRILILYWKKFCYADLPVIISGDKLAYMEPQEKVWRGESGQSYLIQDIHSQSKLDSLAPFEGVASFSSQVRTYHGTLFRFPLREAPSDLSENCYTVQKLHDLLVALREEAKFLLLFLRSIQNKFVSFCPLNT